MKFYGRGGWGLKFNIYSWYLTNKEMMCSLAAPRAIPRGPCERHLNMNTGSRPPQKKAGQAL